ncbi:MULTISPECIES: RcnB family protein [Sphingobium]|uniref:RcnB family protein n=1 Tax=Sphingobium fuliginis (strain ATCC 27551) TaxID=336203 RepID=A0ABQ1FD04_SPHSA|nr:MULTISPECIES: RcnB family protein [Sphingobium]AJR26425.1 hypothetical protein TZ53_15350 [Sphingobium sp. YBL2]RYL95547.1 hypothetical protein EWH10_20900 [Sphingobium fuliginis]WDA37088.1 RcnB family protein [Sphingobium sp. YC-XJ3]GGA06487.1 hypothetical protein GCM10019071_41370 [Sphingobium fuliginis]
MHIRSFILAGAGLAIGLTAPVSANGPVGGGGMAARPAVHAGTTVHRWGPRHQGRWHAGWYAPGGWAVYRRPVVGYVLPRYWVNPVYHIRNYGAYGLPAPVSGYGWSRYYDDAVMTDRDGRVRDYRNGVAWEEAGDTPPPPGIGYDDEVTARDDPPPPPLGYEGRWSGTWRDKDGKTFSGDYEGRFEGQVRGGPGVDFDPPPYAAGQNRTERRAGPGEPVITTTQAPGFISGGYYYPGSTTTTVVVQPAVTTTRTYVTEVPVRRRRVR